MNWRKVQLIAVLFWERVPKGSHVSRISRPSAESKNEHCCFRFSLPFHAYHTKCKCSIESIASSKGFTGLERVGREREDFHIQRIFTQDFLYTRHPKWWIYSRRVYKNSPCDEFGMRGLERVWPSVKQENHVFRFSSHSSLLSPLHRAWRNDVCIDWLLGGAAALINPPQKVFLLSHPIIWWRFVPGLVGPFGSPNFSRKLSSPKLLWKARDVLSHTHGELSNLFGFKLAQKTEFFPSSRPRIRGMLLKKKSILWWKLSPQKKLRRPSVF